MLKCITFGRGLWERKQNKKSYLLYRFISLGDILQEIMNFEYQKDCIIQPPTIRLLSTNLALFLPLPNCSCSRPLAWQKCCCYSGWRTHLRGTLCSTVASLFSANSSFLLTVLPTPEKATDTRAAPALVLAHPSSNSTAPLHHLLLGALNEHQCLDGTTYSEITHLNGQHEKCSAQDSFHMEWQELHLEADLQPKLGFPYNCDKVTCLSTASVPSIQTTHNKNPYERGC